MADNDTAHKIKKIDATSLVESLTLYEGVSDKTGNPYLMGIVFLKSPSGSPLRIPLKYLDDNTVYLLRQSLDTSKANDRQEFQKDILDD